mgnify:CR=1 FL=1
METPEFLWLGAILVMLVLSAFFSGSEAAFLSLQQTKLNILLRDKVPGAERVARIAGHPEKRLVAQFDAARFRKTPPLYDRSKIVQGLGAAQVPSSPVPGIFL